MTEPNPVPADGEWHGVAPSYLWVDLAGQALTLVVSAGATVIAPLASGVAWLWALPAAFVVIFGTSMLLTPRRVRAIGYRLREDDLVFRRGIMWHRQVAVPYGRMQLVDLTQGPIARMLGLAELRFVTAAAATAVTIPGLPRDEAATLRDRLVALAESRRAGL
ncbi:MAG TPA: PH domain-containing protein [Microbacteriaceae bacterium]|nr:PH domain-containing protein [Microbacteriaceae bacterium]